MDDDITLRISGSPGQISARVLHGALGALLDVVEEADKATPGTSHPWVLNSLEESSAIAGLTHPSPGAPLALVARGLEGLKDAASIPAGWSSKMVQRVRTLGRLVGRGGAESVELSFRGHSRAWNIDGQITAHADLALEPTEVTFGSVVGKVDSWSERKGKLVGITLDTGQTITATFPADLSRRILDEVAGRRGEFWGALKRNAAGQPTSLQIVDFEAQSDLAPPIPPSEVRGILRDEGWALDQWLEARGV